MSDLEKKTMEETPQKLPYRLRNKTKKAAPYRALIRPELADELYDKIMAIVVLQKKYKDPNYTAKKLAEELQTNTRYLSAVINSRFGMNYLVDKRYADKNIGEISTMVGFASRQSFYAAFFKTIGETPNCYRRKHATSKKERIKKRESTLSGVENKKNPYKSFKNS